MQGGYPERLRDRLRDPPARRPPRRRRFREGGRRPLRLRRRGVTALGAFFRTVAGAGRCGWLVKAAGRTLASSVLRSAPVRSSRAAPTGAHTERVGSFSPDRGSEPGRNFPALPLPAQQPALGRTHAPNWTRPPAGNRLSQTAPARTHPRTPASVRTSHQRSCATAGAPAAPRGPSRGRRRRGREAGAAGRWRCLTLDLRVSDRSRTTRRCRRRARRPSGWRSPGP